MSKRIIALLMALALIVGVFAACGDSNGGTSSAANNSSSADNADSSTPADDSNGGEDSSDAEAGPTSAGPDDTSELYEFETYWYYDWAGIKEWGADAFSAYMRDTFNVDITFTKPDADQDSKLQLLLTGGDLPEAMILDRGRVLNNVVRANALQEIEQFMYDGCSFAESVGEETRELLKVDGKLYSIPNWPRAPGKAATGGNEQWIVNTYVYNEAGKPALNTLDDLHDYAMKAKELADGGLTAYSGQSIIPFACTNGTNGYYIYRPIFRSLGARNLVENYFTQEDGKIEIGVREPKFVEALRIGNQWYRDGLWSPDVFTDNGDQWVEKLTNGRPALFWYDFSQDDTNNFRRIAVEKSNGETTYEVVGAPNYADLASFPQFPPAEGVEVTYGDEAGSPGWNVNVITTAAERPQRIFDLFTWMISKEGSEMQVLGAPGGGIWEGEHDEDGLPILNMDYGAISSTEQDAAGAWLWTQPAHSDYVDAMKFALNDKAEVKNWVVDIQGNLCTYDEENPQIGQKFKTDQLTGLGDVIDPQSDLGVSLKTIQDQCAAQLPQILMAPDEATFDKLVSDLVSFCESNNVDDVIAAYQGKYDANIELQGFDAYSAEYDVYGLNK